MKFLKMISISTVVAALSTVPAFAHAGPHEAPLLVTALHWLTSPTHAALAVIGSAALVALIVKLKRA